MEVPDIKENHEKPLRGCPFSMSRIKPKTTLSSFLSIQFQYIIIINNGKRIYFQIIGYNIHEVIDLISCGSFNDAVSSSIYYTATNDRMAKDNELERMW